MAKKVVVIGGIALIWVGGIVVCTTIGNIAGDIVGQACLKATTKLITKL